MSDETAARPTPEIPAPTLYECECCELAVCDRKSKGIGYYCDRCLNHFGWEEDCGRPGARHATFKECQQEIAEDHLTMRRAFAAGWRFVSDD